MHFLDRFVEWAHESLADSEEAQQYLASRGSSKAQWDRHKIGFVPEAFDIESSSSEGHSDVCQDREKKHLWCDACRYRRWSSTWEGPDGAKEQHIGRRIVGCIVLPLTSYSGVTVGFQVRSILDRSYDTYVIKRRPEGYFFGVAANVAEIWRRREAILVEGAFDQQLIERLVSPVVVALTTSAVGAVQLRFLRRFVRRVYLCFDTDKAGREAKNSWMELRSREFDLIAVRYPILREGEKDVGDYWKRAGDGAFRRHFCIEIPS
jgi:DNA primase